VVEIDQQPGPAVAIRRAFPQPFIQAGLKLQAIVEAGQTILKGQSNNVGFGVHALDFDSFEFQAMGVHVRACFRPKPQVP